MLHIIHNIIKKLNAPSKKYRNHLASMRISNKFLILAIIRNVCTKASSDRARCRDVLTAHEHESDPLIKFTGSPKTFKLSLIEALHILMYEFHVRVAYYCPSV